MQSVYEDYRTKCSILKELYLFINAFKPNVSNPQYIRYLKLKKTDADDDDAIQSWEGRMNQTKTEIRKSQREIMDHIDGNNLETNLALNDLKMELEESRDET